MSRAWPITCLTIGLLAFVPGAAIYVSTLADLRPTDEIAALTPLVSIPLYEIEHHSPLATKLLIPDTAQWKRIRRRWGEPEFVVFVESSDRSEVELCLADLGMGVQVTTQGHPIPLETTLTPYGYSSHCSSHVGFRAAPGSALLLIVSKSGQHEVPRGKLFVRGDWGDVKDKIVGRMLDEDLRPIARTTAIFGLTFLAFAAFLQRRRVRLRRGAS